MSGIAAEDKYRDPSKTFNSNFHGSFLRIKTHNTHARAVRLRGRGSAASPSIGHRRCSRHAGSRSPVGSDDRPDLAVSHRMSISHVHMCAPCAQRHLHPQATTPRWPPPMRGGTAEGVVCSRCAILQLLWTSFASVALDPSIALPSPPAASAAAAAAAAARRCALRRAKSP